MTEGITWLIMAGREKSECIPHGWVQDTKEAMVLDLLEKIKGISFIERVIVSSNDEAFLNRVTNNAPSSLPLVTDHFIPSEPFSFDLWLRERIRKYKPNSLFYWGGGASPFITPEILEGFCASIVDGENILYTNNFFSSDWAAVTPASVILEAPPIPLDNNITYQLWKHKGIRSIYIAPSIEIIGDVDTPADLTILSKTPGVGENTKKYLDSLALDTSRVEKVIDLLNERNKIFLAGRVGSSLFKYLDTRSFCSFRVLSEERGMRSFGRIEERRVNSIIGFMFENLGIDGTFSGFEKSVNALIMDSRVPFAHICGEVSVNDRFHSDLGMVDEIRNPWVRDFTQRVLEAKIPILTGGHSLILGGTWALVSKFGEMPFFY